MSLLENWGIDLQLFAEEGQVQEPATNENAEPVNDNAGSVEENDIDEVELLKQKLAEKGFKVFDEKEFQSVVDATVTKAIKTREEKLRKQQEIEKMKEKGEFEKLLRQERKEFLDEILTDKIQELDFDDFEKVKGIISVEHLVDIDKQEAKQKIIEAVEELNKAIERRVEKEVAERIKEIEKGSYVSSSATSSKPATTTEELEEIFRKKGLI